MNHTAAEVRRMTHPLTGMLAVAVPLWAHKFADQPIQETLDPATMDRLNRRIEEAGEAVLYRVPGKTGPGFNALAESIARLAFNPGGVRVFGMHWEYKPGQWKAGKHGAPIPENAACEPYDPALQIQAVSASLKPKAPRPVRSGIKLRKDPGA